MPHEIEANNAMFVYQPAWHQLGTVLDHPPTSEEAIKCAGMDWTVQQKEIYFKHDMPGGDEFKQVPERFALVRGSDQKFLSVVSERYDIFQNVDAFQFFDPIVRDGLARYESAGVLKEGRRVWVLARLTKDIHIGDDEVRSYLLLCNSHDGSMRLLIQPTPIRVVCNNTLQMSLSAGLVDTLRHVAGIRENAVVVRDRIMNMIDGIDNMAEEYMLFGNRHLGVADTELYVEEVLTMPTLDESISEIDAGEKDGPDVAHVETATVYQKKAKTKILDLVETGKGATEGTLWGTYNAVIEFVDHFAGKHVKDRTNYQLFGAGADLKIKALETARSWIRTS